ncbi:MAG: bifunctional 23S rRNA (guanine(2069)-N(7))-methyltransferase RlmK/23S rRNA (guanine(2445)-N(2))-methyltransferase RlmL [Methylococcales bacterium]|nr:bifunctional 23S rRNA (guanine(2069)-N(7))-methyltransferase RlmK/23S rRNA (guanine(2445)-N(2))-methyltransferase RlmL [Methylococcales bacterium]
MSAVFDYFVTAPKGLAELVAEELNRLALGEVKPGKTGVTFRGDLAQGYRACLESRVANRVLLQLATCPAHDADALYAGLLELDWAAHLGPDSTLAVDFSSQRNDQFRNSHFGALKVKDAVVDFFAQRYGRRPGIDITRPDVRLHVIVLGDQARVSLDLSGDSLHKRGYRRRQVAAPLKENLAAALLYKAGWPEIAEAGGSLVDPMCGSGTFLLEAALMATDTAPGLLRDYFGFLAWRGHDAALWQGLLDEARERHRHGLARCPLIAGFDIDPKALQAARQHVENAGFASQITLRQADLADLKAPSGSRSGLLISNPPYGERLGTVAEAAQLYETLGQVARREFGGWQAGFLLADAELGFRLGIRSRKPQALFNGPLACHFLRCRLDEAQFFTPKPRDRKEKLAQLSQAIDPADPPEAGQMLINRLRKNQHHLKNWLKREQISCYRLYDADLPEFAAAIDVYHCLEACVVVVQEYQAPKTIAPERADQRLAQLLAVVPCVFATPVEVILKIRQAQKGESQYLKQAATGHFLTVSEGGLRFYVNFKDYLDTGLFLDHRPMRLRLQQEASGKHFLNLFAYTGTASAHAAFGGALTTTSVDLSATYLDWGQRNFALNGLKGSHRWLRADCQSWLETQAAMPKAKRYDVIFLDPPTFSNSKRMDSVLDIQRDHVALIDHAARLLSPGGVLYFSCNFRGFKLDDAALAHWTIEDITTATIPKDFSRHRKIHHCYKITAA